MKEWACIIGIIVGGWGIWYIKSDASLKTTQAVLSLCNSAFSNDPLEQLKCTGNAWGEHDKRQNRALVAIVIGGALAIPSGILIYSNSVPKKAIR